MKTYHELIQKLNDKGLDYHQIEYFLEPFYWLSERFGRCNMEQHLLDDAWIQSDFIRHYDNAACRPHDWNSETVYDFSKYFHIPQHSPFIVGQHYVN